MITDDKIISRVTNFLSKEFSKNTGKVAIFRNDDGSYELFDKYSITEFEGKFIVTPRNESRGVIFSSLKYAVAWCVHDNNYKFTKANRIKHLDTLIAGTEVAMEMHNKVLKSSPNTEKTLIQLAKLNEEKSKRAAMLAEMDEYVKDSTFMQTKKFSEKR